MPQNEKILRACGLFVLLASTAAALQTDAQPNAEQRAALLASAGRYAEKYMNSLPNFICVRVNQQFEGNKKGDKWHKGDTLTSRLEWRDGREKRTLQLVNDKPLNQVTRRWRTPLTTEGEFGSMLEGVFSDQSNASFDWDKWDQIDGKKVAVFRYSIDRAHSLLSLGDTLSGKFTLPYHGFFAIDPDSGIVLQVNVTADEIPRPLQTKEIATTVNYGDVKIGETKYVLPQHATVISKEDRGVIRNEMLFESYRKFEAESSVTFGSADAGTPPNQGTPPHPK